MPRTRTRTTRKKRRRGRGIGTWAKKGLAAVKSNHLISRGADFLNNKYGNQALSKIKSPLVRSIAKQAVQFGITKLKQKGYGTTRAGMGLTRAGNGLRRAGMGRCCRR